MQRLAREFLATTIALSLLLSGGTCAYALGDHSGYGHVTTSASESNGTVEVGAQTTQPGTTTPGNQDNAGNPAATGDTATPQPASQPDPCAERTIACGSLGGPPQRTPTITADQVAAATARLHLPTPQPMIGPDPTWNEWNALAIGYPIWYWTNDTPQHTTLTQDGITITIHATPTHTTINPGDNTPDLTCTTTTPYDRDHTTPGTPSPDCGHTYTTTGTMTITATTHWTITWTAAQQTGTLTTTRTDTRTLDIITLNTVING